MQDFQRTAQFRLIRHFYDHRGRAEDFFLEQFVALKQQAYVGLEQLRLRLVPGLLGPGQMAYPWVLVQALHAAGVAA
ncbi:hypothetical protein D3C80_1563120 [compost metagenome]